MSEPSERPEQARGFARRPVEIAVSLVLILLAALVLYDNYNHGAGWDGGPQTGFFPARVAWIFLGASLFILWQSLQEDGGAFVSFEQLGQVARVLGPLVLFVALIAPLGLYVASALFIVLFMTIVGKSPWWSIALTSLIVPLACFWVFDVRFQVLLPKGPLEAALGF